MDSQEKMDTEIKTTLFQPAGRSKGEKRKRDQRERDSVKTPNKRRKMLTRKHGPVSSHSSDSTHLMVYGMLMGYNVVESSGPYLVVQSASGYGNISQSNGSKRISSYSGKHVST